MRGEKGAKRSLSSPMGVYLELFTSGRAMGRKINESYFWAIQGISMEKRESIHVIARHEMAEKRVGFVAIITLGGEILAAVAVVADEEIAG
jgi:hypothetical protein